MKGWGLRIFCILLIVGYIWLGWSAINTKMKEKDEVTSYISMVTKWNNKQTQIQDLYTKEVVDEKQQAKALSALAAIIKQNDTLIAETKNYNSDSFEVKYVQSEYQDGLSALSDAYRSFYHAMLTNENKILADGEKSLQRANDDFQAHEESLTKLANKNFINLQ